MADKPAAGELGWRLEQTARPYAGGMLAVRRDRLKLPKKEDALSFEYIERAAGVVIVPVTQRGEIVLIRQYRYPVDAWCLETPAGGLHDTGDTPLEEVVRKELREEIGAAAGEVEQLGSFFPAPSYSDEQGHVFVAWDVELNRRTEEESGEEIKIQITPAREALRLARSGGMATAVCALAVLWCEELLRARSWI